MLKKKNVQRLTNTSSNWLTDSLLIVLVFGIVYFTLLGTRPLFVPDEGRYAEIAREMAASNNFITPYLNGIKYFEKPALFYWLGAGAIKLGGLNLWSLRSINAVLGILGILITYLTTRKLYSRTAGIYAAFALGSSVLYFIMSHMISLDLPVTVFLSASLYALLLGLNATMMRERRAYTWLAAAMAAAAVLTKGLIGMVFPTLIFFAYTALTKSWHLLKTLPIASSLVLFLAIAAPWHLLVGHHHPDFYYFYFIEQHFLRYTHVDIGHYQPIWFFIPCIILGFFPWIMYLPQTLWTAFREAKQRNKEGNNALFFLLWAGIIFCFFSISKSKLIPYVLPVLPPLAILTGHYLADIAPRQYKSVALTVSHLLMFALACGIAYVFLTFPQHADLPNKAIAGQILHFSAGILLAGLGCAILASRFKLASAIKLINVTMLCFLLTFISSIPYVDARSILPLANIIKPRLTRHTEVITYNQYYQDLPFYLERRVNILNWQNEMTHGMLHQNHHDWMINDTMFWKKWQQKSPVFVIMDNDEFRDMQKQYPDAHPHKLAQTVNNTLISNQPL